MAVIAIRCRQNSAVAAAETKQRLDARAASLYPSLDPRFLCLAASASFVDRGKGASGTVIVGMI